MAATKHHRERVSELTTHIGFWLRLVSNEVSQSFARRLGEREISVAEWVVLRVMYGHGQITASVLAEAIGMTRGAVSKIVDKLVNRGLIARGERGGDRRFQEIGLTSAGRLLVPALAAIADQNDAEFFAPLSQAERQDLLATLNKLSAAHSLRKLPTE